MISNTAFMKGSSVSYSLLKMVTFSSVSYNIPIFGGFGGLLKAFQTSWNFLCRNGLPYGNFLLSGSQKIRKVNFYGTPYWLYINKISNTKQQLVEMSLGMEWLKSTRTSYTGKMAKPYLNIVSLYRWVYKTGKTRRRISQYTNTNFLQCLNCLCWLQLKYWIMMNGTRIHGSQISGKKYEWDTEITQK
jgi:hypothetical protein